MPGIERGHAIEPVRQESKEPSRVSSDDARHHAGLLGKNLERQENFKIHGYWLKPLRKL